MIDQKIIDYIRQQLGKGVNEEEIGNSLLAVGWKESDIRTAFGFAIQKNKNTDGVIEEPQQTSPADEHSGGGSKKLLAIIVAVIIGLLLFAGGAFGYFVYFKSPEKIIQKMNKKSEDIKSLEYEGNIKTEVDLETTEIAFSGAIDYFDMDNPKAKFEATLNIDMLLGPVAFETKILKDIFYVKLNNVPNPGFFDISSVVGEWIKIDIEKIKEKYVTEEMKEQINQIQNIQQPVEGQTNKIKQILAENKIFKVIRKLPSEKVNEVNSYHYSLDIDKEEIINFYKEVLGTVVNNTFTEAEIQETLVSLENIFIPEAEIWISKKELLPRKLFLRIVARDPYGMVPDANISMNLYFKSFNEELIIEEPISSKPLEELLEEMFGECGIMGCEPDIDLELVTDLNI